MGPNVSVRALLFDIDVMLVVSTFVIAALETMQDRGTLVRSVSAWCMDQGCGRSDPSPVWDQATRT